MKEQILNWLKYDRTFFAGMQLYARYGHSLSLKAALNRQGETSYNTQMLRDELGKLAGLSHVEVKAICEIPVRNYAPEPQMPAEILPENPPEDEITTVEQVIQHAPPAAVKAIRLRDDYPFLKEKDCPKELKVLVADMLTAYDAYKKAHEALFTAETEAQLLEASKATVEDYLENRAIWAELNHYKDFGKILGSHQIFKDAELFAELAGMSAADLSKKKGNVASQITRLQKAIDNPKDPEKLHQYLESLELNKRLKAEIERLLAVR